MERKQQEPFDREAWRKLLGADTGAPTEEIDRRILAKARRALAPRSAPRFSRWWLPASLAASLLLAVLLVQHQLADVGKPAAVTEADVPATLSAEAARDRSVPLTVPLPAPRQNEPASAATKVSPPLVDLPSFESPGASAIAAPAEEAPAPPPAAEPPISAITATGERMLTRDQTTAAAPAADAGLPTEAAPAGERGKEQSTGMLAVRKANESYAESRTPEQWYKDIAALRASGHIKEADAEFARFKSRYPDWLEQHHRTDP